MKGLITLFVLLFMCSGCLSQKAAVIRTVGGNVGVVVSSRADEKSVDKLMNTETEIELDESGNIKKVIRTETKN